MEVEGFEINKEEITNIFKAGETANNKGEEVEYIKNKYRSTEELSKRLKSDMNRGISGDEIDIGKRIRYFDTNFKEREPLTSFWEFVCETLEDTFLRILIFSAFFQIGVGASPLSENPQKDWIDGLAILFAVVVIVLTTSVTNYSKEKKFRKLTEEEHNRCQVLVKRNGVTMHITDQNLLTGDIVKIEVGMILPADGILIVGNEVKIDESSITGESSLMRKETLENCLKERGVVNSNRKVCGPLLYSGTTVKSGSGWMMILAIGVNSYAGRLRETVLKNSGDEEANQTPLEHKLDVIANDIGKFGLWAAILTFSALMVKLIYLKWTEYVYHTEEMNKYNELIKNSTMYSNNTNNSNISVINNNF